MFGFMAAAGAIGAGLLGVVGEVLSFPGDDDIYYSNDTSGNMTIFIPVMDDDI